MCMYVYMYSSVYYFLVTCTSPGYMPAPRLPASKPEPRAPELAWDPQKALGGLGLL